MSEQAIYCVYSREHNAWWKPNSMGYARDIELAGRYTLAQADEICEGAGKDQSYHVNEFHHLAPDACAELLEDYLRVKQALLASEARLARVARIAESDGEPWGRLKQIRDVCDVVADACNSVRPKAVRLPKLVRGDHIFSDTVAQAGVYSGGKLQVNEHGAVSVLADNGLWLGVKPGEFEVVDE